MRLFDKCKRNVYVTLQILFLISLTNCSESTNNKKKNITIVSWGGEYQEELFNRLILPTASSMELEVNGRSYTGEYRKITSMVESRTVTWDLVQVETFYAAMAYKKGLLEPFNPPVPHDMIVDQSYLSNFNDHAYPTIAWSYVLAWNQNLLNSLPQKVNEPTSWEALWDLTSYPGTRALRDVPQGNIEIALLADGMSMDEIKTKLYIGRDLRLVDRALDKLSEIKAHLIWWKSGNQIQRELETGGVILAGSWNGRVWKARTAPITEDSLRFDIRLTYNQAILDFDWWIIPKGSKNRDLVSKFMIGYFANDSGGIDFSKSMGYGPVTRSWEQKLSSDTSSMNLLKYMPTSRQNIVSQLETDPFFWADHWNEIGDRWAIWRAE